MEERVAVVTGGLRGLGRAMALGLAGAGHRLVAIGHIESDIAEMEAAAGVAGVGGRIWPLVADLREARECDRVVAEARARFGEWNAFGARLCRAFLTAAERFAAVR